MKEPSPGHALFGCRRSDGKMVGVLDVPRGDRCGCVCGSCGEPLRANQGRRRQYFSHVPGLSPHCAEGALHRAICEALADLTTIELVPLRDVPRVAGLQKVVWAVANSWIADRQFRPDVLLEVAAGMRIAVEVVDTHPLSGFNLQGLRQEGLLVMLIDAKQLGAAIRREGASRQTLNRLVRHRGPWQSWPVIEDVQQPDLIDSIRPWWDVLGEQPTREMRGLAAAREWCL